MKKTISKITTVLLVLVVACGLGALNFTVAGAVEPQSPAQWEQGVTPNEAYNDGASLLQFSWHCWDWVGTGDYYTFSIHEAGNPVAMYEQSSAVGDMFDGITEPLQDIYDWAAGTDIYNPEGAGNTHDWTVPATVPEGDYQAWVHVYIQEQTEPEASTMISFDILQAEGNLEIRKYRTGTTEGLEDWEFSISGPESDSGATDANGILLFTDLEVGDYTITETLKSGWHCTDPGASLQKDVTVVFNETAVVTFENEEEIGDLEIFKYEDVNGNGVQDGGEAGLEGWAFSISGPVMDSGTTNSSGYLTFSDIPVGTYTIEETILPGWRCTDPGASGQDTADVITGQTATVDFGNQELGDLRIFKYHDENNSGTYESADESGLGGWEFTVSGVSGIFTTASDGYVTVANVVPGSHTVTETLKTDWQCTDPGSSREKTVNVPSGDTADVQFGNYQPPHLVPTLSQWGIIILAGSLGIILVLAIARRRRPAQAPGTRD